MKSMKSRLSKDKKDRKTTSLYWCNWKRSLDISAYFSPVLTFFFFPASFPLLLYQSSPSFFKLFPSYVSFPRALRIWTPLMHTCLNEAEHLPGKGLCLLIWCGVLGNLKRCRVYFQAEALLHLFFSYKYNFWSHQCSYQHDSYKWVPCLLVTVAH